MPAIHHRTLGRRESEAEVMYGRLWNMYMTYQMPNICIGK